MKHRSLFRTILCSIGIVAGAVVAILIAIILWYNHPYLRIPQLTNEQLDSLGLDGIDRLMIVAHPDDEYIWGGAHLLADDWFVVVITNGDNERRSAEFEAMMEHTGDRGLMLRYPDKIAGGKSRWDFWEDSIRRDIATLLSYKSWKQVVTHNEAGEYGHRHHIVTHRLTVEAYEAQDCSAELNFFGTYYTADSVPPDLASLDADAFAVKNSLAYIYESQSHVVEMFRHMLPHEVWQTYRP